MVFEGADDGVDDLAVRAGAAFDVDVGLGVGGPPLLREPLERGATIAVSKHWPGITPAGTLGEDVDRGIEPDGYRPLVEELSGSGIDICAATSRDNPDLPVDQPRDDAALAVAEIVFAEPLEDLPGGKAGSVLDRLVAIDEREAEPARKPAADGRFPGSHQADENNRPVQTLAELLHGLGLYSCRQGRAKALREPTSDGRPMSRPAVLFIALIIILIAALFLLSSRASEVPTRTIEVEVQPGANAQ